MALEIKQSLRLSQQLRMTPQLQQAIKLLQLNRMELAEAINAELMENPVLEEAADAQDVESSPPESGQPDTPETQNPESQDAQFEEAFDKPATNPEEQLTQNKDDDFNWESYVEETQYVPGAAPSMREIGEELPSFENALTRTTSLEEHLTWQLSMCTMTEAEDKLGELIIGNLTEDGYLSANLQDLALETGIELEDAEELLKMIQRFDPLGVGARDLRECLLVQAMMMDPRDPIMERIIAGHLNELEKKNYSAVAKSLGIPLEKVIETTRLIMELEPKPGRSFMVNDTQYITPDIYVYKVGTEFVIVLNEDGIPKLRISSYYKNILSTAKTEPTSNSKMTKEYVQDKLRSAVWLIRSIHNRQKTIYKVTEAIVKRQREFFVKGVQFLKPMVLKDVANDIGMHESTISRVTTNKYVHTPMGIFELKYFFNSSIAAGDGTNSLASEAVKEKIRQLVSKEDPKNPLSDQKIVELLLSDNIDIARRTVAKYRDMLGILSSSKRKQVL